MSNKLALVIDGNYHFHKTLHVYGHYCKGPLLGSERDIEMFMRKIATDLAFAVRQVGKPERVIFTIDKNSWRKNVEIEENLGYKANRVKDESQVDWKAFNNCMQEFAGILKEFGCIISEINGCEGDDLMYYWANKLYEDGEDVVIITGDGDINQLTKHNDNNFIVVYNIKSTDRKIVASPGFDEFLADDSVSLFDSFSYMGNNKDVIKTIIDANKLSIVDPKDVLFDKILMGDAGDNVPPILSWQETQKSGRIINRSITTAKLERVKELLEMRGIELDVTKMEEHAKVISQQIKIIYDKEITEEMTANRIKRNTKLVYLSDETIPIEYRNLFEKHYSENKANGYPKIERWDMHTLLGKTKYGQTTNAFESDVFKTFKSAKPKVREDEPDNTSKKLF